MEEKRIYTPQIKEIENTVFWNEFGNHTRIELKNSALAIGKVAIGLQKFGDDNKQIAYTTFYLDIDKALVLAEDILSGRFARIVEKQNTTDMVIVHKVPGGQSAEKANRADKKPLYRELSISKGKLWVVACQEGPGKVTPTGGFMPDGKYETKVMVGLSNESLKAMATMIKNEIMAYRVAQYLKLSLKEA